MKTNTEICVEYVIDNEREDFYKNPSRNHVYFHALCAQYSESCAEEMLAEAIKKQGRECFKCKKPMGEEMTEDYEFWPTHLKCLGPYDAWIDHDDEIIHKQGFESAERADEVLRQDYPESKHWTIKKVRP